MLLALCRAQCKEGMVFGTEKGPISGSGGAVCIERGGQHLTDTQVISERGEATVIQLFS